MSSLPSVFRYLPEVAGALTKIAEGKTTRATRADERPLGHVLGTVGSGLAGMGAGTLAGYGAGAALERLSKGRLRSGPLKIMAPIVGGAAGVAYNLYKHHELEELRRALKSDEHESGRSANGSD